MSEIRAGIHVESGASVSEIHVDGDVYAGDKIEENVTFDVSGLPDPYVGLDSYTYATRLYYGGREQEVRDTVRLLTQPGSQPHVLFITGASGCGKSSFVRAGLIPALEEHYALKRRDVRSAILLPGQRPLAALMDALGDLGSGVLHEPVMSGLRGATATQRTRNWWPVLAGGQFLRSGLRGGNATHRTRNWCPVLRGGPVS